MRFVLRVVVFETVMATVLFASAGRIDLPWFWAMVGVHTAAMTLFGSRMDPELVDERFRPTPGGTDRLMRVIGTLLILAHLIIAGLDARFGWSRPPPWPVRAIALLFFAAGLSLSMWSMVVNRFFSPVVRIQSERGHHVIDRGPYAHVRHPGYAGMILAALSGGVVLGSWWSLVPLLLFIPFIFPRLAIEEAVLRRELSGYDAYAGRVRYKLLPGLW